MVLFFIDADELRGKDLVVVGVLVALLDYVHFQNFDDVPTRREIERAN